MELFKLLVQLDYQVLQGTEETLIHEIVMHSKEAEPGDVFVCIAGAVTNGHKYVAEAIMAGVSAIVIEDDKKEECSRLWKCNPKLTVISVPDTRYALALMAGAFYDYPAGRLKMIGITGTKGKTTAAYMIKAVFEEAGYKVGLIGTVETVIGDRVLPAGNTTPESLLIQQYLHEMLLAGCDYVVMEVSSQGLKLHRTAGIFFKIGVFTNLGADHIGPHEHQDAEEYAFCKSMLFEQCHIAVGNLDDPAYDRICGWSRCQKLTYGLNPEADISVRDVEYIKDLGILGMKYKVCSKGADDGFFVRVQIPGVFSVYNSLAAIAVSKLAGIPEKTAVKALSNVQVKGRIERVPVSDEFTVMIDYAHNAMSLQSILLTLREYSPGRLVVLFGCGGNRARGRRFEMGETAGMLADYTIITSDNPRFEDPHMIIDDIVEGMKKTAGKYISICDRKEAMRFALVHAQKGDVIVFAGKGHENYQEINGVKYEMEERRLISEIMAEM